MPKAEPKYLALYNKIIGEIEVGNYRPGDRIPSDNELMRQYTLSKSTVTKALDLLVNNGVVRREQGRGSFVTGLRNKAKIKCFLCPASEAEQQFWQTVIDHYNQLNSDHEVVP